LTSLNSQATITCIALVKVLIVNYINELATQYERLVSIWGSIFGIIGFIFGTWRYLRELKAQKKVVERQRQLDDALSRLQHLEDFASGLDSIKPRRHASIWTTVPATVAPPPNVPVLLVGNLKGGVGKTTTVAHLAVALVKSGFRVLAIDMDFQASLSVALPPSIMTRYEKSDGGVNVLLGADYDMFHDSQVTSRGNGTFSDLSLVRTSLELADIEDRLLAAFMLGRCENDPRFALARKLQDRRLRNDFDLVIIDTPPRLTMASINALCASTHVLIPTALTHMAQSGAVTFGEYLTEFRKNLCPSLKVLGVLPTFTKSPLSPAEHKVLDELEGFLPGVDVWRDIYVPTRQPIANNNVQQNALAKSIFQALAEKIIGKLELKSHGNNKGSGSYWRAGFGGPRLPQ
jgi:cellulose biosynthesis protein BcsQ